MGGREETRQCRGRGRSPAAAAEYARRVLCDLPPRIIIVGDAHEINSFKAGGRGEGGRQCNAYTRAEGAERNAYNKKRICIFKKTYIRKNSAMWTRYRKLRTTILSGARGKWERGENGNRGTCQCEVKGGGGSFVSPAVPQSAIHIIRQKKKCGMATKGRGMNSA